MYFPGLRVLRFGSRRPLRIVLTIVDSSTLDPNYLLSIGPLGIQYGPFGGVLAGHADMPPGSRSRDWPCPWSAGKAIGLTWDGSGW